MTAPKMGPKTARALELRKSGLTLSQVAVAMGLLPSQTARVSNYLAAAKRHELGLVMRPGRKKNGERRIDDPHDGDERNDVTPGCARCSLRGDHECLPVRAEGFLRQQEAA